jgi:hypothetical protein
VYTCVCLGGVALSALLMGDKWRRKKEFQFGWRAGGCLCGCQSYLPTDSFTHTGKERDADPIRYRIKNPTHGHSTHSRSKKQGKAPTIQAFPFELVVRSLSARFQSKKAKRDGSLGRPAMPFRLEAGEVLE